MFVEKTLVIFAEAAKVLIDGEFPLPEMQDMTVHVDYPLDVAGYPGLWVSFVPNGEVRNVGIGHVEYQSVPEGIVEAFRWQFSGVAEITVAALSSLERARMIDWLSKAIAFGHVNRPGPLSDFRNHVEHNDLIGLRVAWESFTVGGMAETPGTPWGSDDVIYEATVSLTVEGEYVFAPDTEEVLVPLSAIVMEEPVETSASLPTSPGWI